MPTTRVPPPANALCLLLITLISITGCTPETGDPPSPAAQATPHPGAAATGIPTLALYGDLHVHTSWSTDAYSGGNRVGPDDAWRFARGETVKLPSGIVTQLARPLDFAALTDHAEGFAQVGACTVEDHPLYDSQACRNMRTPPADPGSYFRTAFARGIKRPAERDPALCADLAQCRQAERATWQRVQASANAANDPGRFTALVAYEFSALLPDFGMLHRNVIFRGSDVIEHAISSLDVRNQAHLFEQLDAGCQPPCAVLTIPHNTNFSWGLMFARSDEDGASYTAADLERRVRIDRLVEVAQRKGESECRVDLGASDEACNFEKLFPPCADGQTTRCAVRTSYVRNALLDGIQMASEGVINPFKLGMIGSTDTHGSDPGNVDPPIPAQQAAGDPQAAAQVLSARHPVIGPTRRTSNGALAAVWARENTRAEVFDALRRREAFATSGPRLKLRFFAGNLAPDIGEDHDAVAVAYANGTPMGGDLVTDTPPRFWAWAARDPDSVMLARLQVVKGWIKDAAQQHRVWDVACGNGKPDATGRCPPGQATVDLASCQPGGRAGAAELQATFTDPDFDPDQHAFYYVRVLEDPTCRWTTWLASSAGLAPPDDVPATIQNRGWSSPIWIQP